MVQAVGDIMTPAPISLSTEATVRDAARYMRERYLDIKVLYLTGFRDVLFKEKGSLWADEAFLDKPCTPDGLLEAVSLLMFGTVGGRKPERSES